MEKEKLLEVVERAIRGDKQAFEELCRVKAQGVLYYCTKVMGNTHDGQDAAQEVFIKMQRYITTLNSPKAFGSWLNHVATHTCINMKQKDSKSKGMLPVDEHLDSIIEGSAEYLPEEYVANEARRQELLEIIDGLPDGMRTCIFLYYFEDLKTTEIASVLDVSEVTVRTQLNRARVKIRMAVKAQNPEAYTHALAPISVLGHVLKEDAQCMQVPKGFIPDILGRGAGAAAKSKVLLTLCGGVLFAVLLGTIFASASSYTANVLTNDPQRLSTGGVGGLEDMATITEASAHTRPVSQEEMPAGNVMQEAANEADAEDAPEQAPPKASLPEASEPNIIRYSVQMRVSGRLVMVDNRGELIANMGICMPEAELGLKSPGGSIIAKASPEPDGSFTFEAITATQDEMYELCLLSGQNMGLAPAGDTPTGVVCFKASQNPQIYLQLTETMAPRLDIVLHSMDCACGHVNPGSIKLEVEDALEVQLEWRLVRNEDGKLITEGKGDIDAGQLGNGLENGLYTLWVEAQDAAGNSAQAYRVLRFDTEPIDENQYG